MLIFVSQNDLPVPFVARNSVCHCRVLLLVWCDNKKKITTPRSSSARLSFWRYIFWRWP